MGLFCSSQNVDETIVTYSIQTLTSMHSLYCPHSDYLYYTVIFSSDCIWI